MNSETSGLENNRNTIPFLMLARFEKIGSAYAFINELSEMDVEVIELLPLSSGSQVLLSIWNLDHAVAAFQKLEEFSDVISSAKFAELSEKPLRQYLGTSFDQPLEEIWIAESSDSGAMLELLVEFNTSNINVVDFRSLKGNKSDKAFLIASCKKNESSKLTNLASESRLNVEWTPITNASDLLKAWFEN